ncbi:MAG: hypothetical protein QG556_88, partial [Pseudomonadota bacterium]|nr:hypothetical protein [Pseudomonadota bacterium]
MFTKIYSNLQQAFQLSWFKFLFWNTSLAKLIVQEEKPSAWDFFNTYLSSWWWTRLWFRAFIRNKKHLTEFDQIIKSLQILKNAGIFNEDNFNLILNHANLSDLAATLLALQDTRILLQDNFTLLANQAHPNIMASALSTLHQADILTPKNQAIVATDPREWDFILILLNNRGMLTPNNFNLIANHANPRNLAMALSDLQEAGILTPENQAM